MAKKDIKIPKDDLDTIRSLAETLGKNNRETVRKLYKVALKIDSTCPQTLNSYIDFEIREQDNLPALNLIKPDIEASLERCHEMELPWAYFIKAKFYLLLEDPYSSISMCLKAIQLSIDPLMLEKGRKSLKNLESVSKYLKGYQWVEKLLLLGCAAKFPSKKFLDEINNLKSRESFKAPVIILAGGTDAKVEYEIMKYKELLVNSFQDFRGTIISGGTTSGISGLVGDLQETYPDTINTIGYLPQIISSNSKKDDRYQAFVETKGHVFSVLEPIQYWIDLIAAKIEPTEVKLIGINGGKISIAEYIIALALGGKVSIIKGSGRAASIILDDKDWKDNDNLTISKDIKTLKIFIGDNQSF